MTQTAFGYPKPRLYDVAELTQSAWRECVVNHASYGNTAFCFTR
jgi:hypothetical protein